MAGLRGFTEQPSEPAEQELTPDVEAPAEEHGGAIISDGASIAPPN